MMLPCQLHTLAEVCCCSACFRGPLWGGISGFYLDVQCHFMGHLLSPTLVLANVRASCLCLYCHWSQQAQACDLALGLLVHRVVDEGSQHRGT